MNCADTSAWLKRDFWEIISFCAGSGKIGALRTAPGAFRAGTVGNAGFPRLRFAGSCVPVLRSEAVSKASAAKRCLRDISEALHASGRFSAGTLLRCNLQKTRADKTRFASRHGIQALPLCRKKPKKAREPGAKGDNPRFALLASRHGSRRQPSTAALPEKTEKSKGTRSKTVRIASKMPEFRPALLRGNIRFFKQLPLP